jgi:hypothetical protein
MKGKPMKHSDAFLIGLANVFNNDTSDYEATHKGALNMLEKGRSTATWARVSASVLGEIDDFVQALAGRQP